MIMVKILKITEEHLNILEANYPKSFNMEEFKKINSFAGRKKYAEERLEKLAAGTGRIVYLIDENTVLKLAKNRKGVAQNWVEIQQWNTNEHIMAKVYDYSEDGLWLEMEKARKAKKSDFKKIIGFEFDDIADMLLYRETQISRRRSKNTWGLTPPENAEELSEDFFYSELESLIPNYDFMGGDLARISSYGVVKRDGKEEIVLTDYGLNQDVYDTHYKPKVKSWQRY